MTRPRMICPSWRFLREFSYCAIRLSYSAALISVSVSIEVSGDSFSRIFESPGLSLAILAFSSRSNPKPLIAKRLIYPPRRAESRPRSRRPRDEPAHGLDNFLGALAVGLNALVALVAGQRRVRARRIVAVPFAHLLEHGLQGLGSPSPGELFAAAAGPLPLARRQ